MSQTPRSSASKQSWRAHAAAARPASKRAQRAVFTLFGLLLAAALAWMLWWWIFLPSAHCVGLPIVDYDPLAVPPPRFATEDTEAFARIHPRRGESVILADLQTSQSIDTLENRLQGLAVGRRDTLVIYLRGYGVSDNGKAWLLCSDFLRGSHSGRVAVGELLAQIAQCRASKKLILLDAGDLPCDPRLGMIANEFPSLLAEEVRRVEDSGLWVLAASRPLEVSHASDAAGRSVFSYFATEGLAGGADRDGDGMIELDELTDFVRGGVADWVFHTSGGAETQTPWLLHAGEEATDPPAGMSLLTVSDRTVEQKEGDEAGERTPPRVDPRATAVKEVSKLLDEAWKLRDQCEQPFLTEAPVTPIDYAPHLWLAYQDLLLAYEQRSRGGAAYDSAKLADNLRTDILPLANLISGQPLPPAAGKATIVARLADAQGRTLAGIKDAWGELLNSQEGQRYLTLLRAKNESVFRATDYVRWHAAAMQSSPRRHRLYPTVVEFLTELRTFVDRLEAFERDAATTPSAQIGEALDSLDRQAETLAGLRKAIEEEGLQRDAADLIAAAGKNTPEKGIADAMDTLLATPLLRAAQRAELLRARLAIRQPITTAKMPDSAPPQSPTSTQWPRRLNDQAAIERLLVELAAPDLKLPRPDVTRAENVGALAAQYRPLGKAIGDFYTGLPRQINQALPPGDLAAAQRCERLLRAVDARDVEAVAEDLSAVTIRPIRLPSSAAPTLVIQGPSESLSLDPDARPTPLRFRVVSSATPVGAGRWMLRYDPKEVTVSTADGRTPVAAGQWIDVAFDEKSVPLEMAVVAKALSGRETSLTLTVRADEQTATCKILLRVPTPDRIDLVVRETTGPIERPVEGDDHFHFRPFPNRTNSYRFALLNRSGREKSVSVQLFALPERLDAAWPRYGATFNALGEPGPGVTPLGPPVDLKLAAGEEAAPIPFNPPPKPAAADKPAEKPDASKPPPPTVVSAGIACVVRDKADGKAKWIKWIDFRPRPPREYVAPQVRYDSRAGRIHLDLRPIAAAALPPLSPETPVTIIWDTASELSPNVAVKSEAAIAAADETAALYADVAPAFDKRVTVRLTIDGVPRAFIFDVRCDRDRSDIPPERDLRRVRIVAPVADQAFRVPLSAPMPVELQVDAPEDAFREADDAVELRIVAADSARELVPEERHRFHADRQCIVHVLQLGPRGEVTLDARVGDFMIPMGAGGLRNTKARIMAELRLPGLDTAENRPPVRDFVRVVLDGAPPVFEIEVPGRPVPRGANLVVSAVVKDELSGVDKMEFGFDIERNDELAKKPEPVVVRRASPDGTWTATVPTKELDPGQYRVLVRATDRVGLVARQHKVVTIGPAIAETADAKTSTIEGRVTLEGERPLANIRVTLKGTGMTAVTDSDGRFTFADVPHGQYTIEARGAALGREVSGAKDVVLPAASEPARVEIRLEW